MKTRTKNFLQNFTHESLVSIQPDSEGVTYSFHITDDFSDPLQPFVDYNPGLKAHATLIDDSTVRITYRRASSRKRKAKPVRELSEFQKQIMESARRAKEAGVDFSFNYRHTFIFYEVRFRSSEWTFVKQHLGMFGFFKSGYVVNDGEYEIRRFKCVSEQMLQRSGLHLRDTAPKRKADLTYEEINEY